MKCGKIHLEETKVNLSDLLHDLKTIISGQIHAKQLELYMDAMDVTDEDIYCVIPINRAFESAVKCN